MNLCHSIYFSITMLSIHYTSLHTLVVLAKHLILGIFLKNVFYVIEFIR